MNAWSAKAGTGASADFVHVDTAGNSSSDKSGSTGAQKPKPATSSQRARGGSQTNGSPNNSNASAWQTAIIRLTDPSKPEDPTAIRRLGEEVRAAGANGARAAVEVLRVRLQDKNAGVETRTRAIAIARVLAQRAVSGADAQKFIAAPVFVGTLRQAASDPNIRGSLKTWASQIRIGDPNDATILTPITGLDEHLSQASETATQSPELNRRPPLVPSGSSFTARAADEDPDDDARSSIRTHLTGNRTAGEPIVAPGSFNTSMPGGFGIDDATTPIVPVGQSGLPPVREFPASSIQAIPPSMVPPPIGGPRPSFGSSRPNWPDEDDGVQSDAPSTRSRRPPAQGAFGGVTPSMDGGREARDRLNERGNRRGRTSRTSSLADGTVSDPDESSPRGRHPGPAAAHVPATIPEDTYVPYRPPMHQRARSRHPSVSPGRNGFRSRSPSPSSPATTGRSRATSRARAQSRRRGAGPGADPAAVLVNLAGVQFVRVIQEYYAANSSELTLREGEVLAVIRQEDGGRYWLGHCQGQVGRFPAHMVELLSHQSRNQDPAHEEKTTELLRRAREIDDFMDQLHDFDITRYCITEDRDIQNDLAGLMSLRNELVRHLDETTTGLGRLKAMLNKIKEAQRVHDRMIDSRIASYTARSSLHDNTPRNHYQELPPNPMQFSPYDMSQYMRRTSAPQQIEQPPPPAPSQSPPMRQPIYNTSNPAAALRYRQAQEMGYVPRPGMSQRSRTYSYTPAGPPQPPRRMDEEQSSAYLSSEPTTPGESVGVPPPTANGAPQYAFPQAQQQPPSEGSHTSRRGAF